MRIGIFDSGIGGLTVLKSLQNKHPNHQYIYFGDTINLPYGDKTKEELKGFSHKIITFLLEQPVDIIVIACGTISSNLYHEIKDNYPVPIMDVITPTIDYLNKSQYQRVGIIGTNMTAKSKVFEHQLQMPSLVIACPLFVPMIENNELNTPDFKQALDEYLNYFNTEPVEALVLGCTHYPLISQSISEYFHHNLPLINLGEIIADTIKLTNEETPNVTLYFSKIDSNLVANVNKIIGNYPIIEKQL